MRDGTYDVVLHETHDGEPWDAAAPPPRADVRISEEVTLTRLLRAHAEKIVQVCSPGSMRGGAISPQVFTFSQRYCVTRFRGDRHVAFDCDDDQQLQEVMALSRLVYPSAICLHLAAQVRFEQGEIVEIQPMNPIGIGRGAWVWRSGQRDYLTEAEWLRVAELRRADPFISQSQRWRAAMNYFEYAARTADSDIKFALLVTALEALVHTHDSTSASESRPDVARARRLLVYLRNVLAALTRRRRDRQRRPGSTQQFVTRSRALAHRLRIEGWSKSQAHAAYDWRSSTLHGRRDAVRTIDAKDALGRLLETLLRAVLRSAIEEPAVASIFRDDAAVRALDERRPDVASASSQRRKPGRSG